MLLPHDFWVPHGNPAWRGGVERALMSTTADKAVALHYANGRGTIVEIDVGRIQTGGDVSFLSMVWNMPSAFPSPAAFAPCTMCHFSCAPSHRLIYYMWGGRVEKVREGREGRGRGVMTM